MQIKIANKTIGPKHPVFIIAELGINHNGKLFIAKKMIDVAKSAGVDAIKIQSFVVDDFVGDKNLKYTYVSQGKKTTENQYDIFKRVELSQKKQKSIFDYAKKIGIIALSTPQDNSFKTVDFLCSKSINMLAIKVGSDDLTNLDMLKYYAEKNKPMIISTGMSNLAEIKDAVKTIKKINKNLIILKCTSQYPTPPEEVNLSQIKTLQKHFKDCLIGFSDHTQGTVAAVAATILGANVIEKHFTLDKNMKGPDHQFSADPQELVLLVNQIRQAEKMIGKEAIVVSKKEQSIKNIARRSIMATHLIEQGQKIDKKDLVCKRPGTGLPPKYLHKFIGKKAKKNYKKGYIFKKNDL
ncbi:MAG: N-acetylneuraminate synthase family protein [Candidatus Kuenenbacteria bacterium]